MRLHCRDERFLRDPEVSGDLRSEGMGAVMYYSDEIIEKVVDGVKAKITADKVGDALGALGGLFGKK